MGLTIGDSLADARARTGLSQVAPAEPSADSEALRRLAHWAMRYTPAVSVMDAGSGADGFFLDITGSAHLFGGEESLLLDIERRLTRFGLVARLALADTPGAAWALSRCHPSARLVLPSGREAEALAPLPVAALRLSAETGDKLRRLGLRRIGALLDKPRAPFAIRFDGELLRRLDEALGRVPEPLVFAAPPPVYCRLRHLLDPVFSTEAVIAVATRLMMKLAPVLEQDGVGARSLQLSLYRVDGERTVVDLDLIMPTRNPAHVARLLSLKLEQVKATREAGFGFETVSLAVTVAEPFTGAQRSLAAGVPDPVARQERWAALIDGLRQRLGAKSVHRLVPVASHIPEKAEAATTETDDAAWQRMSNRPRPLLLFPKAERTEVTVSPDSLPRSFRWRGGTHGVAHAEGPERIAGAWWRYRRPPPTRDYFLVEADGGRRFWLYRESPADNKEDDGPARWFIHGTFA